MTSVFEPTGEPAEPLVVADPETELAETSDAAAAESAVPAAPALTRIQANDRCAREVGARWYVCSAYATQERLALSNVLIAGEKLGDDLFVEAEMPTELVEVRRGRKVEKEKRPKYAGYLLVRVVMTDDVLATLKNTTGVVSFAGMIDGRPTPISDEDADVMLDRHAGVVVEEATKSRIPFVKGDRVVVISGPFENVEGVVEDINEAKYEVKVLIEFFGQQTPVRVDPEWLMRRRD